MASTLEPQAPLKRKLSLVKCLLEDANNRLQEEASKYEIFTTKTSASATNGTDREAPIDLYRTISDISTLKSVLCCPIFDRIVNVTDSLDKLSYQLNLHPSIGPADINIDANGELILAPPIEPATLNNIINSKLDGYSDQSNNHSPKIVSPNGLRNAMPLADHQVIGPPNNSSFNNVYVPQDQVAKLIAQHETQQKHAQSYLTASTMVSPLSAYDTEKLVSNGEYATYANSTKQKRHVNNKVNLDGDREETRRLYKSNGHLQLDQVVSEKDFQNTQSMSQAEEQLVDPTNNGYTYEVYKNTQDLYPSKTKAIEQSQSGEQNQKLSNPRGQYVASTKQVQSVQSSVQYNRGSCSPSTSAGSTVRLADECDSGASSYQSHTTKGTPNTEQVTDTAIISAINGGTADNMEYGQIDNTPTEMERIKVTLEKDASGLGITIAGYTCEEEEISGIFIKIITPGSPADRTGKIRVLDQIFAVDGRELLGYSNKDAVNVLRNTGKVVTLELMRYLAESKYRKLQSALANAIPSMRANNAENVQKQNHSGSSSPVKSSIPISKSRDLTQSPTTSMSKATATKSTLVQVSNLQKTQPLEAIYKNDQVISSPEAQSHIPVAAQRGGTNKIIETKQGARNTVDIRSPMYNIVSTNVDNIDSTYVNRQAVHQKYVSTRLQRDLDGEPEWEKEAEIVELYKESQGLGFTVKEYVNPKDQEKSIIMITQISEGGVAERDGRLSSGDLLKFVDDINLDGASLADAVNALKQAKGHVRLGILRLRKFKEP